MRPPALRAPGRFQQRNFALARAAAEAHLQTLGLRLRERGVAEAAAATEVPGRAQLVELDPPTLLDSAHNPDAAEALAEALPELLPQRPLALVLGVLEDKDATAMLRTLLPLCERAWFTAPPSARALPPAALESLARQLGFEASACHPRAARALAEARAWARQRGGAVLATGSVYLVGELIAALGREQGSEPAERQRPAVPERRGWGAAT
jgi:dihydrofolate synthase / folylpolyglutamate synthase